MLLHSSYSTCYSFWSTYCFILLVRLGVLLLLDLLLLLLDMLFHSSCSTCSAPFAQPIVLLLLLSYLFVMLVILLLLIPLAQPCYFTPFVSNWYSPHPPPFPPFFVFQV